jgi:hypothetical protein
MRQMAFDHIPIPGISTKPKPVFSNTRLFISDLRSHLGSEIIEGLECTEVDTSRTLDGDDEGKNRRHISQSNAFIQSIQFIDQKNFVNSVLSPKTNLTDYLEPWCRVCPCYL